MSLKTIHARGGVLTHWALMDDRYADAEIMRFFPRNGGILMYGAQMGGASLTEDEVRSLAGLLRSSVSEHDTGSNAGLKFEENVPYIDLYDDKRRDQKLPYYYQPDVLVIRLGRRDGGLMVWGHRLEPTFLTAEIVRELADRLLDLQFEQVQFADC